MHPPQRVLFTKMECAAHMLTDTAVIRPVTTAAGDVVLTMAGVSTLGFGIINACYCVHKSGLTCPTTAATANNLARFTNEPVSMTNTLAAVPFTNVDMNCSLTVSCSYGTGAGADSYLIPKEASTDGPCMGTVVGTPIHQMDPSSSQLLPSR
eukprot:GHVL01034297.1.p3 GENE.GHVL01034297.1~~GHVL01034297.1.p3  ORF type:complete len:152 (+),score=18.06 GHVL01034297.1:532-987(+)